MEIDEYNVVQAFHEKVSSPQATSQMLRILTRTIVVDMMSTIGKNRLILVLELFLFVRKDVNLQ